MNFTYNDAWFVNESLAFYLSSIGTDTDGLPASRQLEQVKQGQLGFGKRARRADKSGFLGSCAKFCDNLVLSFKGKMFVLELNVKLKIQSMGNLTRRYLHGLPRSATGPSETEDGASRQSLDEPYLSSFWRNIEQPNSRKSLGAQQEKILHRLEQVVQAKRQQQYQFGAGDQQLFNMNRPEFSAVLGHIRAEPTCHQEPSGSSGPWDRKMGASGSVKSRKSRWIASAWRARVRNNMKAADADEGAQKLCVICYTNAPNIFTLPCQHQEICSDCFIEIIYMAVKHAKYPLKCVICRQKIEKIRCSRKLLLSVIEKNRIMP